MGGNTKGARHHELLEEEYQHGRISFLAYGAAAIYRAVLETAENRQISPIAEERVLRLFHHLGVGPMLTNRQQAAEHVLFVRSQLGTDDETHLRTYLIDRKAFSEPNSNGRKLSWWAINKAGKRFRQACEDLASAYHTEPAKRLSTRHA